MTHQTYRGSCLCNGIRYEVDVIQNQPGPGHCHCSMCRKFHGAAFATYGAANKADFRWVCGQDLLKSYAAENGTIRQFCSQCGASLIFADSAEAMHEVVEFALATLDDPIELRPTGHIFTRYKANWASIEDGLPTFLDGRLNQSPE